uniref:Uncharacterized protein n=1 Tax=uncultured marine virus TaxID=186617 RepID=A0A0F7L727_9VIRU|nr:hypothetical protein [uncultured marine virus]
MDRSRIDRTVSACGELACLVAILCRAKSDSIEHVSRIGGSSGKFCNCVQSSGLTGPVNRIPQRSSSTSNGQSTGAQVPAFGDV